MAHLNSYKFKKIGVNLKKQFKEHNDETELSRSLVGNIFEAKIKLHAE
jgi:hypothetical protein